MARINTKILRKELAGAIANSAKVRGIAYNEAENRLSKEKQRFLTKFQTHKVSQEISEGPDAQNITNTLGGYGNLFSFIGFDRGDSPVERAAEYFDENIRLKDIQSPKVIEQATQVKFSYRVEIPDGQEMNNAEKLQMPQWDTGSWLSKIENGMTGLLHYIYFKGKTLPSSHSGPALQRKEPLRETIFSKRKYITTLLKDFISRLDSRFR